MDAPYNFLMIGNDAGDELLTYVIGQYWPKGDIWVEKMGFNMTFRGKNPCHDEKNPPS